MLYIYQYIRYLSKKCVSTMKLLINNQWRMKRTCPQKNDLFAITASTLLQNESFLTSGCSEIDSALRGGFSRKGITQIYGEAGSGKTQFALQLCLTVQIPTKENPQTSEAHFPTKRLQELLKKSHIAKKYPISGDMIFVEHVPTMEQLEECICQKIPCLLKHRKIGLLIVDSIAAPFRVEYDEKELRSRAKSLRKIGEQLRFISKEHEVSVICINQVSAVINKDLLNTNGNGEQPTLGIIWASLISNSFHLYRRDGNRYLRIVYSPYLPCKTIKFEIRDIGIVGFK
ncbi:DNA repair protein XRCC3 isoform X2 [Belonocnema kinseyi]|uniref:DNA repair protein XRCC3 isoform X2 n=1 Tax=Belonocnema kinseyi TaxID=2817044 RepID=UPI00143CE513|nr:DNA repair protein XRCC3 isoform X2 [Belonocnema kinseyi]